MAEKENVAPKKDDDKILAAVATVPIVGLVIYFAMKDASDYVRHYAKQGMSLFLVLPIYLILFVLYFIPVVNIVAVCLTWLLGIVLFVLWLLLVVNALQEKKYSLPVLTDIVNSVLKD